MSRTIDSNAELNEFKPYAKHTTLDHIFISSNDRPYNDRLTKVFENNVVDIKNHADSVENLDSEAKTLQSIDATIYEVLDDVLRIKLEGNVFINVPKVVFDSKRDIMKYGQSIKYSIKQKPNGIRFQDIDLNLQVKKVT